MSRILRAKRAVEWCGTHPFATGLMALTGLAGTILAAHSFQLDRKDAAQTSRENADISSSVDRLFAEEGARGQAIAESLEKIEEGNKTNRTIDRLPAVAGLPYPDARERLIVNGWLPDNNTSSPDYASSYEWAIWHHGFREVDSCAGTGAGQCLFRYYLPGGQRFSVITFGQVRSEIDPEGQFIEPDFSQVLVDGVRLEDD